MRSSMMKYTRFLFSFLFASIVDKAFSLENSNYLTIYDIAKNMGLSESRLDVKSDYLRVYQHANSLCLNTRLEELDRAREKEKSLSNRILGAASIGLTGVGAMQLGLAIAEEKADEKAEMQMKAYLTTFRCDYADDKNIVGGTTNFVLPGANELRLLIEEYKELAADLRLRKETMGLKPGIESEDVIDKIDSGLYDDESGGETNGVFTSLSRALSDDNSEDSDEWGAQRKETEQKRKTGAILTGGGIIGGTIGNLGVNKK